MPAAFEIFSGENLMIQVPIYVLEAGWTWKGVYDAATAYVTDDAILGLDNIGYHVIAPTTGHAPPNATYYEVLDPVQARTITSIVMQLVPVTDMSKTVVSWTYKKLGISLTAAPLVVGTQYIIQVYGAGDDFSNVGAANVEGEIFGATATTPTVWTHGSVLEVVTLPPNFELVNGMFSAELLPTDTIQLNGLYEIRIIVSSYDNTYIATSAQTDVLCIPDALQITRC